MFCEFDEAVALGGNGGHGGKVYGGTIFGTCYEGCFANARITKKQYFELISFLGRF